MRSFLLTLFITVLLSAEEAKQVNVDPHAVATNVSITPFQTQDSELDADYIKELENAKNPVSLIAVPNANHFDMINALADSNSDLFKTVVRMIFA